MTNYTIKLKTDIPCLIDNHLGCTAFYYEKPAFKGHLSSHDNSGKQITYEIEELKHTKRYYRLKVSCNGHKLIECRVEKNVFDKNTLKIKG
jgi:hypothetical protein